MIELYDDCNFKNPIIRKMQIPFLIGEMGTRFMHLKEVDVRESMKEAEQKPTKRKK